MYKHILYATDLTEDTDYIVQKVRQIRGYTGAKLSIVHVVEPLPGYSYAYLGVEDIEGQLIDEARQAMEKLGTQLTVDKADLHVEVGPTKTKILKIADEIKGVLSNCKTLEDIEKSMVSHYKTQYEHANLNVEKYKRRIIGCYKMGQV